jgi:hypothetical protein
MDRGVYFDTKCCEDEMNDESIAHEDRTSTELTDSLDKQEFIDTTTKDNPEESKLQEFSLTSPLVMRGSAVEELFVESVLSLELVSSFSKMSTVRTLKPITTALDSDMKAYKHHWD